MTKRKPGARPRTSWNVENSTQSVLSCSSRSEARAKYLGAIHCLERNGLLDEVFEKLPSKKHHYTDEECIELLKSCKNRNEFRKKHRGALAHLEWTGKSDEIISLLPRERVLWTHESAIAEISKYNSQAEFRDNSNGAYGFLRENGLLEEVRKRLPGRFTWKKEDILAIAKKYQHRTEFKECDSKAYYAAYHHGYLDEACAHMTTDVKPKYTTEELRAEALKYNTRREFEINNPRMYRAALKYNISDEICSHMKRMNTTHTKEECHEAALQCLNRSDFEKKFPAEHAYAYSHGWMDEICSHMEKRVCNKQVERWTIEMATEIASKYETKVEMEKDYSGLMSWIRKHGLVKKLCGHMKPVGNSYMRYIYAVEFDDHAVYVGLTFNTSIRWQQEVSQEKETVYKYMKETGLEPHFKIIHDKTDKDTASRLEGEYEEKYRQEGWKILNKAKTGSVGGRRGKYTLEKCLEEVKKYKTLKEFSIANRPMVSAMQKYGWLEELHKILPSSQRAPYTFEELKELAARYTDRAAFWRENQGAYKAAKKMSVYEEICKHMPRQDNYGKMLQKKGEGK